MPAGQQKRIFESMAPIIGAALRAYPAAVPVDPGIYSPATVARRFHTAIHLKQQNGWSDASIDDGLFALHADKLNASIRGNQVIVGPRATVAGHRGSPAVEIEVDFMGLRLVCEAFGHLHPRPTNFIVRHVDPHALSMLSSVTSVQFRADEFDSTKIHII